MATITIVTTHKRKLKQLEIEALKVNETNLRAGVDDLVGEKLNDLISRIEVLEAIVTDKKYQLNEEITQLK